MLFVFGLGPRPHFVFTPRLLRLSLPGLFLLFLGHILGVDVSGPIRRAGLIQTCDAFWGIELDLPISLRHGL
jgi:hypothetical protein